MEKIKVLVLGLGNFGHSWADSVLPACGDDAELVGVVDQCQKRWNGICETVPKFTAITEALDKTAPDLVINVTPPNAHLALTALLLRRNIPVLCEKPIADSLDSAVRMGEVFRETGGFLMIGENYRYHPVFRKAKALLRERNLGKLHHIQCNFRHYHPDYSMYYHGALPHPLLEDVTIHHLDLARYLSGKEPVRVWCREFPAPYSWYGSRPASAMIVTEMTDNVVFQYIGTLASPESSTDWNGYWELEYDRGILQIRKDTVSILQGGRMSEITVNESAADSRVPMLQEACQALRENRQAETAYGDNFKTFLWMHSAIRSSETQAWVTTENGSK